MSASNHTRNESAAVDECKTSTGCKAPSSSEADLPWSRSKDEEKKTEFGRLLQHYPEGRRFSQLVRDVWGGYGNGNKHYRMAERLCENYSDYFNRQNLGDEESEWWVFPTPKLQKTFSLDYGRQQGRNGDGTETDVQSTFGSGDWKNDDRVRYPKDRAVQIPKQFNRITEDSVREYIAGELETEIANKRDKTQVMKRTSEAGGPEYILMPMTDRFSDGFKARESYAGFCEAFEEAKRVYKYGVMLTLTTDPKNFESIEEAMKALLGDRDDKGNKSRLMDWLKYRLDLDSRPDNIHVLEFTDSGLPHIHLCLFGVHYKDIPSEEEIAEYWGEKRGQGEQVDKMRIRVAGDRWRMRHNADLQYYLSQVYNNMMAVAEEISDVSDLREGWKLAFYWCMGRRIYSASPSLKVDDDGEDESEKSYSYEFVGAAPYHDIPYHITANATWIDDLQKTSKSEGDGNDDAEGGPPPCSSR